MVEEIVDFANSYDKIVTGYMTLEEAEAKSEVRNFFLSQALL